MGGEVATTTSDEFKALETEMDLRHQGISQRDRRFRTLEAKFHRNGPATTVGECLHQVHGKA